MSGQAFLGVCQIWEGREGLVVAENKMGDRSLACTLQFVSHEKEAYEHPDSDRGGDHQEIVGHVRVVQAEAVEDVTRFEIPEIIEIFQLLFVEIV